MGAKGTISYSTEKIGDEYQSVVTIARLGGDYEIGFTGDICAEHRAAEQSAAGKCLLHMQSDSAIQERLAEPLTSKRSNDQGDSEGMLDALAAGDLGSDFGDSSIAVSTPREGKQPNPES